MKPDKHEINKILARLGDLVYNPDDVAGLGPRSSLDEANRGGAKGQML